MPRPEAPRVLDSTDLGKRTQGARYVHRGLVPSLPPVLRRVVERAEKAAGPVPWQVVKFAPGRVSLLAYPGFERDPFPALDRAWTVDLSGRVPRVVERHYAPGTGQPILHRKELLRAPGDPSMDAGRALTAALDARDLLSHPAGIGSAGAWARRLQAAGVRWTPGGPLTASAVAAGRVRANPGSAPAAVTLEVIEQPEDGAPDDTGWDWDDFGDDALVLARLPDGTVVGHVALNAGGALEDFHAPLEALAAQIGRAPVAPRVVSSSGLDASLWDRGLGAEFYATAAWWAETRHGAPIVAHELVGYETSEAAARVWASGGLAARVAVGDRVAWWTGGPPLGPRRVVILGPRRARSPLASRANPGRPAGVVAFLRGW